MKSNRSCAAIITTVLSMMLAVSVAGCGTKEQNSQQEQAGNHADSIGEISEREDIYEEAKTEYREVNVSEIASDLNVFLQCFEPYRTYTNSIEYDCKNVNVNMIGVMISSMTCWNIDNYPGDADMHYYWDGEEPDPLGWFSDLDYYAMSKSNETTIHWILTNIFNIDEAAYEKMKSEGEADQEFYCYEGYYYTQISGCGFINGTNDIISAVYDGTKYYVTIDYYDGYEIYENFYGDTSDMDAIRNKLTSQRQYAIVEKKDLSGDSFWTLHYLGYNKPSDFPEMNSDGEYATCTDQNGSEDSDFGIKIYGKEFYFDASTFDEVKAYMEALENLSFSGVLAEEVMLNGKTLIKYYCKLDDNKYYTFGFYGNVDAAQLGLTEDQFSYYKIDNYNSYATYNGQSIDYYAPAYNPGEFELCHFSCLGADENIGLTNGLNMHDNYRAVDGIIPVSWDIVDTDYLGQGMYAQAAYDSPFLCMDVYVAYDIVQNVSIDMKSTYYDYMMLPK